MKEDALSHNFIYEMNLIYTNHVKQRIQERGITTESIERAKRDLDELQEE